MGRDQVTERKLVWSNGGGTQSAAIAVLIAQERLPRPERIVIADTGREATETWEYLHDHINPMLEKVGLSCEVASHDLATVDLYGKNGDLLVPAFTEKGKLPTFCSNEWKQRVVRRYLRAGGCGRRNPIRLWIGISTDEVARMKPSDVQWVEHYYPLITDLRITRYDCTQIVKSAGLPDPPKSSCWMCPYRQNHQWLHLKESQPADWEKAVALDERIREHDISQGGTGVYVHRDAVPLAEADLSEKQKLQDSLFGEVDGCDSGYCWS